MLDMHKFREYIDEIYQVHPELFPKDMGKGYTLHGFIPSQKLEMKIRRIKLVETNVAYQIRPSFIMPYMIGKTDE